MSKLTDKLKKNKRLSDIIIKDAKSEDRYLSTNVLSLNLVFSGKLKGGIRLGSISTLAADSQMGKSLLGYNLLGTAFRQGMDCVVIDTENAFNYELAASLGVNLDEIAIFNTSKIPVIKQIYAQINEGLTKEESRNVFVLLDSWGPIVTEQVMDKAGEGSSAVDMSMPRFKNELANVINACSNTTFVINHVYESLQMYGEKFSIPGGKRLFFNSHAIGLATSAAKYKDNDGNILGKVITVGVKKGRGAKEFVKTKYLIRHDGGLDPYFGLLDDALEAGVVFKPKNGYYARTDFDVDKDTGEVSRQWKEAELYCSEFWIPLCKDPKFNQFLEEKFSFENTTLIASQENIDDMIEGKQALTTNTMQIIQDEDEE